jgi:hypothetical protein
MPLDIPNSASDAPPSAGPTSIVSCMPIEDSELAARRSSSPTRRGISASFAGVKNCPIVAWTKLTAKTIHTVSRERARSSPSSRIARRTSATIIVRRRSQRSTKTPATEPNRIAGRLSAMNVPPVASAEPVRL